MRKVSMALFCLVIFAAGTMVGSRLELPRPAKGYSPILTKYGQLTLPTGDFDVQYEGQTIQVHNDAGSSIPVKFTREEKPDGSVVFYGLNGR